MHLRSCASLCCVLSLLYQSAISSDVVDAAVVEAAHNGGLMVRVLERFAASQTVEASPAANSARTAFVECSTWSITEVKLWMTTATNSAGIATSLRDVSFMNSAPKFAAFATKVLTMYEKSKTLPEPNQVCKDALPSAELDDLEVLIAAIVNVPLTKPC